MTREDLVDTYPEETFLLADGFDDALLGVDESNMRVIYSVKKCIEILMEQGMDHEEARDYFNFNTRGAYMGDHTPIWCDDIM
jgi:hypothetical protein